MNERLAPTPSPSRSSRSRSVRVNEPAMRPVLLMSELTLGPSPRNPNLSRRCNRCNVARQPWHIWHARQSNPCMLLGLKGYRGFESHSTPARRAGRWTVAEVLGSVSVKRRDRHGEPEMRIDGILAKRQVTESDRRIPR